MQLSYVCHIRTVLDMPKLQKQLHLAFCGYWLSELPHSLPVAEKSGIEDFSQNPSRVRNVLSFLISESSPSFGIKFERLWNPHSVFPYFPRLPQSSVTKIVLLDPSSMARTGSAAAVMRESVLMTYLAPRQVENPDKHPNFCLFIWTKLGFWTNWASHQWFCHP